MKTSIHNTLVYTQEDFDHDIRSIVSQLRGRQFDIIVGINRGGCLPAVCLSHALKTPTTMIDYSTRDGINIHPKSLWSFFSRLVETHPRILIVDDLIDSGKAMTTVIEAASCFTKPVVATLLHNTDVDLKVEHYWGTAYSRMTEPRYFDFWWEMY